MAFEAQQRKFLGILERIDLNAVSDKPYPKAYLQHLFDHKKYYVAIYARLIQEMLQQLPEKKCQLTIVDYGCGNGLLGLFALQCGIDRVIFQDSNTDFLDAAKKLADLTSEKNALFIPGEIGELVGLPYHIDAVVGTDVIEHIYDLEEFFGKVKLINPGMVTVFSTAANPYNPFIVRRLRKLQLRDEIHGSGGNGGELSGPAHPPYLAMREQYIKERFPNLEDAGRIAETTRGLVTTGINKAIKEYELTNRLPVPVDPFNTCHPETGSWTERILSFEQYETLYSKNGYHIDIKPGFYDRHKKGGIALIYDFANFLVFLLGKTFSPFIIIIGHKK